METGTITIIQEFSQGQTRIEGEPDLCRWKTYLTDQKNIILLRAFMKDGINEVTYDATEEELFQALNRAINRK